jgi:hypothetical protein
MAQASKRTRSQLTLPNSLFDISLDRSPLKQARESSRAGSRDRLLVQADQPVGPPGADTADEGDLSYSQEQARVVRTPPPLRTRLSVPDDTDAGEDEILLSPSRRRNVPSKRRSPAPPDTEGAMPTDTQDDLERPPKRVRRTDSPPPQAQPPERATRHLDLAALGAKPFPRPRSRSVSRSPQKPRAKSVAVSPSRAHSMPVGPPAVPHLDLRTVPPSPWRTSPTKKMARIASVPPPDLLRHAVVEEEDEGAAATVKTTTQTLTSLHTPPRKKILLVPVTPQRANDAVATEHYDDPTTGPRSPASHTPNRPHTQLTALAIPSASSAASSTANAPATSSEPSSPLSPLTPLPAKTPFFGRLSRTAATTAAHQTPGVRAAARAVEVESEDEEAPAGAFAFPPPNEAHEAMAPMDVDPPAPVTPIVTSRPPSPAVDLVAAGPSRLARPLVVQALHARSQPLMVASGSKKKGVALRMKGKDGTPSGQGATPAPQEEKEKVDSLATGKGKGKGKEKEVPKAGEVKTNDAKQVQNGSKVAPQPRVAEKTITGKGKAAADVAVRSSKPAAPPKVATITIKPRPTTMTKANAAPKAGTGPQKRMPVTKTGPAVLPGTRTTRSAGKAKGVEKSATLEKGKEKENVIAPEKLDVGTEDAEVTDTPEDEVRKREEEGVQAEVNPSEEVVEKGEPEVGQLSTPRTLEIPEAAEQPEAALETGELELLSRIAFVVLTRR